MTPRDIAHTPTICPHCGAPSVPRLLVAHIQATVAAYYGFQAHYMKSQQRGRDIAHPRQVAMFLAAEMTPKSLPDIGRCFDRDHTTVMYSIKAVKARLESDAETQIDVCFLRERLSTGNPLIHSQKEPKSENFEPISDMEQSVETQAERLAA